MSILHLCNANFEWELTQKTRVPIAEVMLRQPGLQLQFLPLLYARSQDAYVTTDKRIPAFFASQHPLRHHLLSDADFKNYTHLESWGASENVAAWAKEKGILYPHPNWEIVKEVNSKAFSFLNAPALPNATLLHNKKEALMWIGQMQEAVVFKTCFGVAGGGHLIQEKADFETALPFLQKEWEEGRPMIAEPWVERLLDFSTQWIIEEDKSIRYLGATLLQNNPRGKFRQNQAGTREKLFNVYFSYLEEHEKIALGVLKKIAERGYFGNVGIDAMLYKKKGAIHLHPIVEINARKTMGWVTLTLQQRDFPKEILTLSFSPKEGLRFTVNTKCDNREERPLE